MSQYTLTTSLLLAFAGLTGADMFGMMASDSECTYNMYTSQEKSCKWTGDCSVEGCSDKCVPDEKSHHKMDGLHMAKAMGAMKCSLMAMTVQGMSDSGSDMFSRKMLETANMTDAELQATATRLFCSHKSFADPSAVLTQVLCPVQADSPAQAHVARRLSDAETQEDISCPTAAEIDEVAPTMIAMAGFMEAMFSGALFPSSSTEEETVQTPEDIWVDTMVGYMKDPEALKTFFADECSSESVTEDPLLSMYSAVAMDDYASDDDPTPTSVSACRPKSGEDAAFSESMNTLAAACEAVMDEVSEGQCMYAAVAQSLHTACYEATAGMLGIPDANQATVLEKNGDIDTACRAATTQTACEEVDMVETEGEITAIIQSLEAAAAAEMSATTASEPSHATVLAEGRAMGIIMVAIAALVAGLF